MNERVNSEIKLNNEKQQKQSQIQFFYMKLYFLRAFLKFSDALGSKTLTDAPDLIRFFMTSMLGDSLISSVSGLKDKPQTANFIPFKFQPNLLRTLLKIFNF